VSVIQSALVGFTGSASGFIDREIFLLDTLLGHGSTPRLVCGHRSGSVRPGLPFRDDVPSPLRYNSASQRPRSMT